MFPNAKIRFKLPSTDEERARFCAAGEAQRQEFVTWANAKTPHTADYELEFDAVQAVLNQDIRRQLQEQHA